MSQDADTARMREDWIHLTGGGSLMPTREAADRVNALAMLLWGAKEIDPPLTNGQAWTIATLVVEAEHIDGDDAR